MRLRPWLLEAIRRDPESSGHYGDCRTCMKTFDAEQRALLGCAYEPPNEHATIWSPLELDVKWLGDAPTVCPGYTISLPIVLEAQRARIHWSKNALGTFCGGEPPTDLLQLCIEFLEAESNDVERFILNERKGDG